MIKKILESIRLWPLSDIDWSCRDECFVEFCKAFEQPNKIWPAVELCEDGFILHWRTTMRELIGTLADKG